MAQKESGCLTYGKVYALLVQISTQMVPRLKALGYDDGREPDRSDETERAADALCRDISVKISESRELPLNFEKTDPVILYCLFKRCVWLMGRCMEHDDDDCFTVYPSESGVGPKEGAVVLFNTLATRRYLAMPGIH